MADQTNQPIIVNTAVPFQILQEHDAIHCDTSASVINLIMPDKALNTGWGHEVQIIDIGNNAGTFPITITTIDGTTIDVSVLNSDSQAVIYKLFTDDIWRFEANTDYSPASVGTVSAYTTITDGYRLNNGVDPDFDILTDTSNNNYDNSTSGIPATNAKEAIDYLSTLNNSFNIVDNGDGTFTDSLGNTWKSAELADDDSCNHPPFCLVDSNTINFSQSGVKDQIGTGQVVISKDADNCAEIREDGLYVPCVMGEGGAPIVTYTDSDCIELNYVADELTADLIVDPNPDNLLQCLNTGAFVDGALLHDPVTVTDTWSIDLTLAGQDLTANAIIDPNPLNTLTVSATGLFVPESESNLTFSDTLAIDLEETAGDVTATLLLSGVAGNIATIVADGLYVPETTNTYTFNDTTTIDLTESLGIVTANAIIDPNVDNQLSITGAGLYVSPASGVTGGTAIDVTGNVVNVNIDKEGLAVSLLATDLILSYNAITGHQKTTIQAIIDLIDDPDVHQDSTSIDFTTGAGTVTGDVIISPNAGNILDSTPNGLYVPDTNTDTTYTFSDTLAINMEETGGDVTSTLLISGGAGNIATIVADGLYVPESTPTVYTFSDTNTIDLTEIGNDVIANAIISPTSGNIITATANGLYAPDTNTDTDTTYTFSDTASVDLTLSGTDVVANVVISPNAGNIAIVDALGVYVPDTSGTALTFSDTASVDLTLSGSDVVADVIISPTAGNIATIDGGGVYVPDTSGSALTFSDTASIDLTLSGSDVVADVILDPNPSNILSVTGSGLLAIASGGNSFNDTATIDLTDTLGVITADAIIDPNPLNILESTINGLFVPVSAVGIVINSFQDTSTIDFTEAGGVVTADAIISPTAGNILIDNLNGLYVPNTNTDTDTTYTVGDTPTINMSFSGGATNIVGDVIINPSSINILEETASGLLVAKPSERIGVNEFGSQVTVEASAGQAYYVINDDQDGLNITKVKYRVFTAGTTGTFDVRVNINGVAQASTTVTFSAGEVIENVVSLSLPLVENDVISTEVFNITGTPDALGLTTTITIDS